TSPGWPALVTSAGLGAAATRRRFEAASAAFIHPGRRPTRGWGFGAVADIWDFVAVAHAATTVPIGSNRDVDLTEDSVERCVTWHRACVSSGRSRPSDRR